MATLMADPAVPSREAPLDRAVAAVLVYYQTEAAVADPRESLEEGLRRTLVASGLPAEVERLREALTFVENTAKREGEWTKESIWFDVLDACEKARAK